MTELLLGEHIFKEIVKQAEGQAPIEACGILAGKDGVIEKFYEMTNADNSSDHFMLVPEEQFAVVKAMRAEQLEMLAICHSHPESPARPSQEDIRMAFTPGVVYVIVSLQDASSPVIKGFNIEDGNVTEIMVTITKE